MWFKNQNMVKLSLCSLWAKNQIPPPILRVFKRPIYLKTWVKELLKSSCLQAVGGQDKLWRNVEVRYPSWIAANFWIWLWLIAFSNIKRETGLMSFALKNIANLHYKTPKNTNLGPFIGASQKSFMTCLHKKCTQLKQMLFALNFVTPTYIFIWSFAIF